MRTRALSETAGFFCHRQSLQEKKKHRLWTENSSFLLRPVTFRGEEQVFSLNTRPQVPPAAQVRPMIRRTWAPEPQVPLATNSSVGKKKEFLVGPEDPHQRFFLRPKSIPYRFLVRHRALHKFLLRPRSSEGRRHIDWAIQRNQQFPKT